MTTVDQSVDRSEPAAVSWPRALPHRAPGGFRPGVFVALLLALAQLAAADGARAETAKAASSDLDVAILVSSRKDQCFDSGFVSAIRRLTKAERHRINQQGGVHGRRIRLHFLDDEADAKRTIANVKRALADPKTVAMIGLGHSGRAKQTFDAIGQDIKGSGIPFITAISVNSIFADYPNVFTMQASQDDERLPVMARFLRSMNFKRPAFVGIKDMLFSTALGDGLKTLIGEPGFVADYRLTSPDDKLDPAEVAAMLDDLKARSPDLLVLVIGSNRTASLLPRLVAAGIDVPLFVTGNIENIVEASGVNYPAPIYQLAWEGLPDAFNDRLRQRITRSNSTKWLFEGRRVPEAPGWKTGECKPRPETAVPNVFDRANMRAINAGTQYADMLGLVAAALKTAPPDSGVDKLRAHVVNQLKTTYATGHGIYQGSVDNWSFRPSSRTASRAPFIVMRGGGLDRQQLAPIQFVHLKRDALRQVDTLYLDIDLIRTFRVDDNEKSFFAEFYLSMRRNEQHSINNIEFANAFLDGSSGDRQVSIRPIHDGGPSETYPEDMQIYRVSGKFMFEPHLANYPFDTQRFAIVIRPKSGELPFIVQPPPQGQRDKAVDTDGWEPKEQYVGYDEDFLPVIDAKTHEQSVVPSYRASFVWLMKRETTDYFLRVVVPLAFILIVAYLSIFIPREHFEAIVTIQVTALLSAVALYLALPKVDADSATLSDRIFLFDYMAVALMIVVSIARINRWVASAPWLRKALGIMHITGVPILVLLMSIYVYRASLLQG